MRFQFSIRWMLAVTMMVAAGAGMWVATPTWQMGLVELLLVFFLPAFAAVASQNSTGHAKAFWIGVLVSTVLGSLVFFDVVLLKSSLMNITTFWSIGGWQDALIDMVNYGRSVVFLWSFAPLVGVLCVVARWLIKPPKDD